MNDKKLNSRDKQRRETWESNLYTELIKITTCKRDEGKTRNKYYRESKTWFKEIICLGVDRLKLLCVWKCTYCVRKKPDLSMYFCC